jgi:hypothetical protein
MRKHKHHIIPRHMGGSDKPDNLIELTIEEHANAHKELFEKYNNPYDEIAWKALSSLIDSEEARILAVKQKLTGVPKTEEHKRKIREARKFQKSSGWKWSREESRQNLSERMKRLPRTEESNKKRSETMSGVSKPKIECPHCGKLGGRPQMMQWHFDNCKRKRYARKN